MSGVVAGAVRWTADPRARDLDAIMTAIAGFVAALLTLWLGAWMIERTRRDVDPIQVLIGWGIWARAAVLLCAAIAEAVGQRLERWPEFKMRARLDL